MLEWIKENPGLVVSGGLSLLLCIAGILLGPVAVARLPEDFFTRKNHKPPLWLNILGWVLIVAGIAMIIVPGPGIVVMLAGIMMADFPGKRRVVRWILSRGKVFQQLNRIRAKRNKPPLKKP